MGFAIARTQPLGQTQPLQSQAASGLTDQLKSAIHHMDPHQLEALIKEMQARNPQMAMLVARLADNGMQQSSPQMSLQDISGKTGSQGMHHGHHSPHAHQAFENTQTAQLKQLLDDIKRKQEATPSADASANSQSQSQQEFERKHYTDYLALSQVQPS